jgi:hypothetical protein
MGSDYQRVKVLAAGAGVVTLQVTEEHPDMDAVHMLLTRKGAEYAPKTLAGPLTKLTIPASKAFMARNFAAQLLADYGESSFHAAADEYADEVEGDPDPNAFISKVTVIELRALKKASNGGWLYRATLAVTLKRKALADGFKVGRRYPGRAAPTGDWEMV